MRGEVRFVWREVFVNLSQLKQKEHVRPSVLLFCFAQCFRVLAFLISKLLELHRTRNRLLLFFIMYIYMICRIYKILIEDFIYHIRRISKVLKRV